MSLRIEQDYEYVGSDYWKWRAWIAGDDLQEVRSVRWLLHPSFSPSIVVCDDPSNGFMLKTSGWGTFQLRAELTFAGGRTRELRHNLRLEYPEQEGDVPSRRSSSTLKIARSKISPSPIRPTSPAPRSSRRVFLSYGSADKYNADRVRKSLEKLGFDVMDESQLPLGSPMQLAANELLENADVTVAYLSSNTPSPFVAAEISSSFASGKPTLVITEGDVGPIAGISDNILVMRTDSNDTAEIARALNHLKL